MSDDNHEPTSLTFDTDHAVGATRGAIETERSHVIGVAEQIRLANRVGDRAHVEALSSALGEQMMGAFDDELHWSRPESEPA